MTLTAQSLRKCYAQKTVIEDVSLRVDRGEIVGLLGPNGAGKTTCFYAIVGLIKADAGQVWLDDQELTHAPMHERAAQGLGYLPQEASVFRTLTAEANIMAMLELNPALDTQARQSRLESLLQEFGLEHVRTSLGQSLSGGERSRRLKEQPQQQATAVWRAKIADFGFSSSLSTPAGGRTNSAGSAHNHNTSQRRSDERAESVLKCAGKRTSMPLRSAAVLYCAGRRQRAVDCET